MKFNAKIKILNNTPLKIISCMLGYAFWSILSASHSSTLWMDVPLCFYNPSIQHSSGSSLDDQHNIINAPEKITVALKGKRSDLHAIERNSLAIHVNAEQLHPGPNAITLDNKSLFLPDAIKLVHYSPTNIVIRVEKSK